jgi:hypothetical protein
LKSGNQIKILDITRIYFSGGDPALMLKYETTLKVEELVELKEEVKEIWETFSYDVEKANLKCAVISANEIPQGVIIKQGKAHNFVFEKNVEGKWNMLE